MCPPLSFILILMLSQNRSGVNQKESQFYFEPEHALSPRNKNPEPPVFCFLINNWWWWRCWCVYPCRARPANHAVIRAPFPRCRAPPAPGRQWQLRLLLLLLLGGWHGWQGLVHQGWLWHGLCHHDLAPGGLCRLCSDFCHVAAFQRLLVLCDQRSSL